MSSSRTVSDSLDLFGCRSNEVWALRPRRGGFTLLELIMAMVAATVLLASLAATVTISAQLLEVPPDDEQVWHDRHIADRLANDLRYATDLQDTDPYGFQITKPDTTGVALETAVYESYVDGLTRQITGGPAINLDAEAPSHQIYVDGYSAPTALPSGQYATVRSTSTAATLTSATNLDIAVPPGSKTGDLMLLCVSAKTPDSMNLSESGWQASQVLGAGGLRLIVVYAPYNPAWASTIRITSSPASAMAAAMLTVENVDLATPVNWTGAAAGFSIPFLPSTIPTPEESNDVGELDLNVQVVAAELDPWIDGDLGIAGFTQVAQVTAANGDSDIRNTLGIVLRNGPMPDLSTTPRPWHQTYGTWIRASSHLEPLP